MINLSYRFDQNSSSLEIAGMPDVSNGDSEDTIGILSRNINDIVKRIPGYKKWALIYDKLCTFTSILIISDI